MAQGKDRFIYDDFMIEHRYLKDEIKDWYTTEKNELIIELYDGVFYCYDYVTKDCISSENVEDFFNGPRDEHDWKMRFVRRVRKLMALKGITQHVLSKETGIPQATLSNYLGGHIVPTAYKLTKIAKVLGCSTDDLINFD